VIPVVVEMMTLARRQAAAMAQSGSLASHGLPAFSYPLSAQLSYRGAGYRRAKP